MLTDEDLAGKRAVVMGLGRFGGQMGAIRYLANLGCELLVTDVADGASLAPSVDAIRDLLDAGRVELRLGGHNVSDFTACDVVVVSPAVPRPWENRFLRAAQAAGVPLTTEIRMVVERLPNRERTIGVTGTAGKSTTTAMIAHALRGCADHDGPRVWMGGNIGGSLLEVIGEIGEEDYVVLELSSAQLYWLDVYAGQEGDAGWSPWVAVVTNFSVNHLDWHGSEEHYRSSKAGIAKRAGGGVAVVGDDSGMGLVDGAAWRVRRGADAMQVVKQSDLRLSVVGKHNVENACLAAVAADQALGGGRVGECLAALEDFGGLPHRLQRVDVGEGARFAVFDDSKCTTPEAARLAIEAFDDQGVAGRGCVHLICGGYDKGVALTEMVEAAAGCAGVYTIGATGKAIAAAVRDRAGAAEYCGTMERGVDRAVREIRSRGEEGRVLLLSPGCASWDQFANYEERGERFVELVRSAVAFGCGSSG